MGKLLLIIALGLIFTSTALAGEPGEMDCKGKVDFRTAEVSVESYKNALAAYQIDIRYDKKKIMIVGLEGGSGGFKNPPFYDRTGLEGGHIIIAAFVDNDSNAKAGKSKVALLHLRTTGCAPFKLDATSTAAASPGGTEIPVKAVITFIDNQSVNNR